MNDSKPTILPPLPEKPRRWQVDDGLSPDIIHADAFDNFYAALERWKADIEASMVRYWLYTHKDTPGYFDMRLEHQYDDTHYIDAFGSPQTIEPPKDERVTVEEIQEAIWSAYTLLSQLRLPDEKYKVVTTLAEIDDRIERHGIKESEG